MTVTELGISPGQSIVLVARSWPSKQEAGQYYELTILAHILTGTYLQKRCTIHKVSNVKKPKVCWHFLFPQDPAVL